MRKGKNVKELTHEEWLLERREGIGGSDVAAIMGVSPWKSAATVYLDKIGELPLEDNDSERMRIGRDLEEYVAQRFAEATGKKVRRNNYMLHHDDYHFIFADIDREVVGENAILECKTTSSYGKSQWENEAPLHYQLQCQHYMLVTGAEICYIACLIGNEAFVYHVIERDAEAMSALLSIEKDFWTTYVEGGQLPPPDGSDDYSEALRKIYPGGDEKSIELSSKASRNIARLDVLNEEIKERKAEVDLLKQEIQLEMKDSEIAYGIDGRKVTYKSGERTSLDTKKLKLERPDIYKEYAVTKATRTFKVSAKKEMEE